jgi:uncharacterized membrane protein
MARYRSVNKPIVYFSAIYILYVLVHNFLVDPGAETFLSHKTDPARELKPQLWLAVLYLHIGFACVSMASGLINFSIHSDEKRRRFHRLIGYIYVSSVVLVVLTSGYMAPYATGGKISSIGYNLLNMLWLVITTTALVHIRNKRVVQHRRWMIRSYVFCYTNLLIHLLTFVLQQIIGISYTTSYTIGLYGAIVLLIVAPEVIFRIEKSRLQEL